MDCINNQCMGTHSKNDDEYAGGSEYGRACKSGAVTYDGYCKTVEYYNGDQPGSVTMKCDVQYYGTCYPYSKDYEFLYFDSGFQFTMF